MRASSGVFIILTLLVHLAGCSSGSKHSPGGGRPDNLSVQPQAQKHAELAGSIRIVDRDGAIHYSQEGAPIAGYDIPVTESELVFALAGVSPHDESSRHAMTAVNNFSFEYGRGNLDPELLIRATRLLSKGGGKFVETILQHYWAAALHIAPPDSIAGASRDCEAITKAWAIIVQVLFPASWELYSKFGDRVFRVRPNVVPYAISENVPFFVTTGTTTNVSWHHVNLLPLLRFVRSQASSLQELPVPNSDPIHAAHTATLARFDVEGRDAINVCVRAVRSQALTWAAKRGLLAQGDIVKVVGDSARWLEIVERAARNQYKWDDSLLMYVRAP